MVVVVVCGVQKNKKYTEQDVFVPWHLQKKFVKGQEGAAVQEEPKKPKKKKKTRKQRAKEELERKQRGESVNGGDENSQHADEDKPKQQQPAEAEESTPTDHRQAGDSAQVFHRYLSPACPSCVGIIINPISLIALLGSVCADTTTSL